MSFTNIVKCNNASTLDTTQDRTKEYCIAENRFIWREIDLLRPKLVVFYTNIFYDDYIDKFMPNFASTKRDNADCSVTVGQKTMPWWDRSFFGDSEREVMRFLRVGHPERKQKQEFVKLVAGWISSNLCCAPKK